MRQVSKKYGFYMAPILAHVESSHFRNSNALSFRVPSQTLSACSCLELSTRVAAPLPFPKIPFAIVVF